jgi:hypothetical protein
VKRFDDAPPWELLGVAPDASRDEVQQAYERLTALLAPGALALYSAADTEEQRRLQRALHAAYLRMLSTQAEEPRHPGARLSARRVAPPAPAPPAGPAPVSRPAAPPAPALPAPPVMDAHTEITGTILRRLRESRGRSAEEVAARTRIRRVYIESLEREDFRALPERVFTRGFVMTYARELGLEPDRVWAAIEPRYVAARPPEEPHPSS